MNIRCILRHHISNFLNENMENLPERNICAKDIIFIWIYINKLLKNYYSYKKKFIISSIQYLDFITFENLLYGKQDHNSVLIISPKLALQLSLTSGCWISARFFAKEFCNRSSHQRWVKIIIDYKMKNCDFCYISLILYHNLKEKLRSENIQVELKNENLIYNIYLVTRLYSIWHSEVHLNKILKNYRAHMMPKYASNIHISYINDGGKFSSQEVQKILSHYFSSPKYVHVGDVIAILIDVPENIFDNNFLDINQTRFLFFVVTSFQDLKEKDSNSNQKGFLISKDISSLYLSGSEKVPVPYLLTSLCSKSEKVPPCLKTVFDKAASIIQSCHAYDCNNFSSNSENSVVDIKMSSLSLDSQALAHIMLIGPSGSGKTAIIKLLATKFSYSVKWVNCLDLKGDTSAATEGKIKQAFSNTYPNTIIVLIRIGSLSKDKDDLPDPRVYGALAHELKSLKPNVFIISTTESGNDVSEDIWSLFPYHFKISSPNQEERNLTLKWLLSSVFNIDIEELHRICDGLNDTLSVISHRTAGFYFGDLENFINRVHRYVYENKTVESSTSVKASLPTENDFLNVLGEIQELRSEMLELPRIPKVFWRDVGGLEEAKRELINTIQLPIKHPTLVAKNFRRSGILLYGPPGTGKTLLAKSVASECGLNFLSVKGPELINMYIGQSEENVRNVFAKAKEAAPSIIFFDELDSLAPRRGRSGDSGGVMDRIVSALLTEIDGVSSSADVFVLGATNRPDIIPLDANVSLDNVVLSLSFNLTGADFAALATDAFYIATRRVITLLNEDSNSDTKEEVTENDLLEAAENLVPSVSFEELKMYKEIKSKSSNAGLLDL
ncbi:Peroxisome assembly factor 2 [Armadillidium vulgare]|nr:Peroxisome assembly factor 2 [Armadillidium vulgare]